MEEGRQYGCLFLPSTLPKEGSLVFSLCQVLEILLPLPSSFLWDCWTCRPKAQDPIFTEILTMELRPSTYRADVLPTELSPQPCLLLQAHWLLQAMLVNWPNTPEGVTLRSLHSCPVSSARGQAGLRRHGPTLEEHMMTEVFCSFW